MPSASDILVIIAGVTAPLSAAVTSALVSPARAATSPSLWPRRVRRRFNARPISSNLCMRLPSSAIQLRVQHEGKRTRPLPRRAIGTNAPVSRRAAVVIRRHESLRSDNGPTTVRPYKSGPQGEFRKAAFALDLQSARPVRTGPVRGSGVVRAWAPELVWPTRRKGTRREVADNPRWRVGLNCGGTEAGRYGEVNCRWTAARTWPSARTMQARHSCLEFYKRELVGRGSSSSSGMLLPGQVASEARMAAKAHRCSSQSR